VAQQLPLPLALPDCHRLERFVPGAEAAEAWQRVQALRAGRERFGFLWGGEGTGKTHLLQGLAAAAGGAYLELAALQSEAQAAGVPPAQLLAGLSGAGLVALDGLEAVAGIDAWETAVFHLYNELDAEGGQLLIAARANPNSLGLLRSELRSRLHWAGVFPLGRLSDEERLAALQQQARGRGLQLKAAVGWFLLRHYSRNMHHLMAALAELDEAALAERRALTIPLVKAHLGL
jgi:DnaA family protein